MARAMRKSCSYKMLSSAKTAQEELSIAYLHCRNILPRKSICSVADQQAGFTNSTITRKRTNS